MVKRRRACAAEAGAAAPGRAREGCGLVLGGAAAARACCAGRTPFLLPGSASSGQWSGPPSLRCYLLYSFSCCSQKCLSLVEKKMIRIIRDSCSPQGILILRLRRFCLHCSAAAAAKSLQSSLTLRPQSRQPTRLPVPGVLQARTLGWAAVSFSSAWKWKGKGKSRSPVRLLATPWTAAHQAPASMGFSRQEDWSGCHCLLHIVPLILSNTSFALALKKLVISTLEQI